MKIELNMGLNEQSDIVKQAIGLYNDGCYEEAFNLFMKEPDDMVSQCYVSIRYISGNGTDRDSFSGIFDCYLITHSTSLGWSTLRQSKLRQFF